MYNLRSMKLQLSSVLNSLFTQVIRKMHHLLFLKIIHFNLQEEDIDATIKEVNELLGPLPNGGLQASSKQESVGLETKSITYS